MKKLIYGLKNFNGKDKFGHITVFHKGGGHKRKFRIIDFYRLNSNEAYIKTIEYDPNRSANISLICYNNGILSYILTPLNIKIGDKLINSSLNKELKVGNKVILGILDKGTVIHNLSYNKISKSSIIRSAGTRGIVLSEFLDNYIVIKLPSGELKAFLKTSTCILGIVSNDNNKNIKLKKAGESRWRGKRPIVRGVAMNPIDHPHGGGEGKSSGGHPKTPWGFLTKGGYKTRSKLKKNKYIIQRRNVN